MENKKYEQLQLSYASIDQKLKNISIEKDRFFETNEKVTNEKSLISNLKIYESFEILFIHFFQMAKEKVLLEGRLAAATQKIVTEEEQNRQNIKLRTKLEAKIKDYEQENEKLKKVDKAC